MTEPRRSSLFHGNYEVNFSEGIPDRSERRRVYPEELLGIYETVLEEMARQVGQRKKYKELVRLLRRMKLYPHGKQVVDRIVAGWRQEYKRRPAMMEELDRL